MDIRLFKFMILVGGEIVVLIVSYILPFVARYIPIHQAIQDAARLFLLVPPVLMLLPEDNWIWMVEENPRSRKISLRSKAVKHLHLSMLYILLFFGPSMILCISILRNPSRDFYSYILTPYHVIFAVAYGAYCAWKNYRNVMDYESLFAVAWDRRSAFIEIFVGFKVSRRPYFFYSGFGLLCGLFMLIGSFMVPFMYYHVVVPPHTYFDLQKYIVMSMVFHFFLTLGVWGTTMYVMFQALFARNLEKWSSKSRDRKKKV